MDRSICGSGLEREAKSSSLFYIVYLGGAESPFIDRLHVMRARAWDGGGRGGEEDAESNIFLPTSSVRVAENL